MKDKTAVSNATAQRLLSLYERAGTVEDVKKMRSFSSILFIWGGIIGGIGGCALHRVNTAPTSQVNDMQQQTSSQKNAPQQSEEPASLEAFNTFLDRG